MIGLSWVLVAAATVALALGFARRGVLWPSISVVAAIAAGLSLVAGVLRARPGADTPEPSMDAEDHSGSDGSSEPTDDGA